MFFSVSVVIMETKKKFRPYPNLKLMDQSIKGLSLLLTHCPQTKGSRADLPPFFGEKSPYAIKQTGSLMFRHHT